MMMKRLPTRVFILSLTLIGIFVLTSSCSSLDFFSYRENTGLLAIEKPKGYGSIKFGAEIAPFSTEDNDYLAVSGGEGQQTVVYKVTEDGKLDDMDNLWKRYPINNAEKAKILADSGAGASLAGLSIFFADGKRVEGSVAIGQPKSGSVMIFRPSDEKKKAYSSSDKQDGFGRAVASIPPRNLDQWLLVVAANRGFEIISDALKSDVMKSDAPKTYHTTPVSKIGKKGDLISELAGGWFQTDDVERLFVAASSSLDAGGSRVYLYAGDTADAKKMARIGCLEREGDDGFGASLLAADINGDGVDELLVGSPKQNKVYLFNVMHILNNSKETDGCLDPEADIDPLMVLSPEAGEWDVDCDKACEFGAALALGDIATDDDGPELIIGAPKAAVDGVSKAGAVYIYRGFESESDDEGLTALEGELAGQVMASTPKSGHLFGGQVAITPAGGRNELAVGAPGGGRVYIAFCTGVGEDINKGADVPHDADGKVVSTRCRL